MACTFWDVVPLLFYLDFLFPLLLLPHPSSFGFYSQKYSFGVRLSSEKELCNLKFTEPKTTPAPLGLILDPTHPHLYSSVENPLPVLAVVLKLVYPAFQWVLLPVLELCSQVCQIPHGSLLRRHWYDVVLELLVVFLHLLIFWGSWEYFVHLEQKFEKTNVNQGGTGLKI